ncbi:MAG: Hpt domain-containing protein [Spirochaetaceae bacterium]|jgi:HPt (histidine-containing phosphotransfer) domain-containing protein|nr:Hpt domain-containing protein [Spirochaetaceae bacterium]
MEKINFSQQAEEIGISLKNLIELYRLFVEQTDKDIIELNSFITEEDPDKLRDTAHHIKGACLNLELNKMVEVAVQMQLKVTEKNWENQRLLLLQFTDLLNDLKKILHKVEHE